MFGHDTEMALRGAVALVNTMPSEVDPTAGEGLPDLAALRSFLVEWSWSGMVPTRNATLDEVRDLRPRLRAWWTSPETAVVDDLNALFAEYDATPRVVRHGPYGWHLHAAAEDAPLAHRMAVEAAVAVVDLLRAEDLGRLKTCHARGCDRVLVDLSRNRSRAFCEGACADRTHAAAYRARRSARDPGTALR
jgi:predicted RNA-binding Zn ribbon-like protein